MLIYYKLNLTETNWNISTTPCRSSKYFLWQQSKHILQETRNYPIWTGKNVLKCKPLLVYLSVAPGKKWTCWECLYCLFLCVSKSKTFVVPTCMCLSSRITDLIYHSSLCCVVKQTIGFVGLCSSIMSLCWLCKGFYWFFWRS